MNKAEDSKVDVTAKLLAATIEEIAKLDDVLKCLNTIQELQEGRGVKRTWFIAQPENTYSLGNFNNPKTLYIDNLTGDKDITIIFDNEPISFEAKLGFGTFIPCQGAKSFTVSSECRILAINQAVLGGVI
jgi:hypothetical protein